VEVGVIVLLELSRLEASAALGDGVLALVELVQLSDQVGNLLLIVLSALLSGVVLTRLDLDSLLGREGRHVNLAHHLLDLLLVCVAP
jgi:hypothetical protein